MSSCSARPVGNKYWYQYFNYSDCIRKTCPSVALSPVFQPWWPARDTTAVSSVVLFILVSCVSVTWLEPHWATCFILVVYKQRDWDSIDATKPWSNNLLLFTTKVNPLYNTCKETAFEKLNLSCLSDGGLTSCMCTCEKSRLYPSGTKMQCL